MQIYGILKFVVCKAKKFQGFNSQRHVLWFTSILEAIQHTVVSLSIPFSVSRIFSNLIAMFLCENRFALVVFLLLSVGIFYVHSTSDVEKYLVFRLYTPESPNSFIRLNASDSKSISESAFNPNRTTVIFVHGYMSKEKVLIRYKDAYLKLDDCNFIGVDWIRGAGDYNYLFPRGQVPLVSWNEKLKNSIWE